MWRFAKNPAHKKSQGDLQTRQAAFSVGSGKFRIKPRSGRPAWLVCLARPRLMATRGVVPHLPG